MPRIKLRQVAGAEAELLRRLRARGNVSRVELARGLNLAPSTVGVYVDRLIEQGFLTEAGTVDRQVGRPPKRLELNPNGGRFVGVDVEARNLLAVAVDFSQQPLCKLHKKLRPGDTVERVLTRLEQTIEEALEGDSRPVLGIGVGVPGTIDPQRGVARHYRHISGWRDVPLAARLGERFKVPIYLENNIRSMALAEMWFGAGRGIEHFVCIGVRSGIGAGIVAGGRLYHGNDGLAGKLGAWPVAPGATLEDVAGMGSIMSRLSAGIREGRSTHLRPSEGEPDWNDVVHAWHEHDPLVRATLDDMADTLGTVVSQLNLLLNPGRLIVAGPLASLGEDLVERLQQRLADSAPADAPATPAVIASELGEYVGALGAAGLAVQSWVPQHV